MQTNFLAPITAAMLSAVTLSLNIQLKETECAATFATWLDEADAPTYELENACTTIDQVNDAAAECNCIQANLVDWDGARCGSRNRRDCPPENYFSSAEFQLQEHDEKLDELWEQLTGTPRGDLDITASPTKVKCQNFGDFYMHLNQAPGISMGHTGDEMPNFKFDIR